MKENEGLDAGASLAIEKLCFCTQNINDHYECFIIDLQSGAYLIQLLHELHILIVESCSNQRSENFVWYGDCLYISLTTQFIMRFVKFPTDCVLK